MSSEFPSPFRHKLLDIHTRLSEQVYKACLELVPLEPVYLSCEHQTSAFKKLTVDFPSTPPPLPPSIQADQIQPIHLASTQSGRNLIAEYIQPLILSKERVIMVELGCFLGGSSALWASLSPSLSVIGVDLWSNDFTETLSSLYSCPAKSKLISYLKPIEFKQLLSILESIGSLTYVCHAMRTFPNFYPFRSRSQNALLSLYCRKLYPDIIYFDADKNVSDVLTALHLFPQSLICGDDFKYKRESQEITFGQSLLKAFESRTGHLSVREQSWVFSR